MTRAPAMPGTRWVALLIVLLAASTAWAVTGDIVLKRGKEGASSQGIAPSVFEHWVHRIRYRCYVCHPALFEMGLGVNEISMESINKGQSCGACHNGKVAFGATFENCGRCHQVSQDGEGGEAEEEVEEEVEEEAEEEAETDGASEGNSDPVVEDEAEETTKEDANPEAEAEDEEQQDVEEGNDADPDPDAEAESEKETSPRPEPMAE